jgi:hypothetical protein
VVSLRGLELVVCRFTIFSGNDYTNPKNGSRSSLELAIFFKVKLLAAIDDFTIWVRCGAVENR